MLNSDIIFDIVISDIKINQLIKPTKHLRQDAKIIVTFDRNSFENPDKKFNKSMINSINYTGYLMFEFSHPESKARVAGKKIPSPSTKLKKLFNLRGLLE